MKQWTKLTALFTAMLTLSAPAAAAGPHTTYSAFAGPANTMMLGDNGAPALSLRAWGDNAGGQLGPGATPGLGQTSVATLSMAGWPRSVAFGTAHGIAAMDDGSVQTWGAEGTWLGRVILGDTDPVPRYASYATLREVRRVAAGAQTSYALNELGTIFSFGVNNSGQLGSGSAVAGSTVPVRVPLAGVQTVDARCDNAAAIDSAGTVHAWGSNASGQLGTAPGGSSSIPVVIGLPVPAIGIAVGCSHMLALGANGQVYAWGSNSNGQLGTGGTAPVTGAVAVPGVTGVAAIAAGGQHSIALLADGTLRTWGANGSGQLGNGAFSASEPSPITPSAFGPAGSRVTTVAAGDAHTVVGVSGTGASFAPLLQLFAAGENGSGQLGFGTVGVDVNVFTATARSPGVPPVVRRTGLHDVLLSALPWRNVATGENLVWPVNALAPEPAAATFFDTALPPWRIVGTGDINFDQMTDLIWYNPSTGDLAFWGLYASGTTLPVYDANTIGTVAPGTGWAPVAVGDVDGDGIADVVWRNSGTGEIIAWYLRTSGALGSAPSMGAPGPSWTVVGTGDFDGNQIADVLFRNTTTGEVAVWFMTQVGGRHVARSLGVASLAWQPQVIVDLDGDGHSDVFWRNPTTGENLVWYMNGTAITSRNAPTVSTDWNVVATYSANAFTSPVGIVWRNGTTGEVYYWTMQGRPAATVPIVAQGSLGAVPLNWIVARQ